MPFVVAPEEKSELLCTFAALLLHDEGLKVDGDNIQKLITASGATVEPYWPKLFAGLLAGKDVNAMLMNAGGGGGGAGGAAGGEEKKEEGKGGKGGDDKAKGGKGGDDKAKGGKGKEKEKEKEAEKEASEDGDTGFSLFDA